MSEAEVKEARASLLLMAKVLHDIAQSGDPKKIVAACDSMAIATANPDWLLPAEVYAAQAKGLN